MFAVIAVAIAVIPVNTIINFVILTSVNLIVVVVVFVLVVISTISHAQVGSSRLPRLPLDRRIRLSATCFP